MQSWWGLRQRVGQAIAGRPDPSLDSGAEQDSAAEDSTGQHSTGQSSTGQHSTGQSSTGQSSTGQSSTEENSAEQQGTEEDRAEAEQDRIARGEGVQEQIARGEDIRKKNRVDAPGPGRAAPPEQAPVSTPGPRAVPEDRRVVPSEISRVPSWLATGAAWSWRLLLLGVAIYLVARILGLLYIVVLPCIAALLLTALLQPLTARLRHAGLHALASTWVTLLIALAVLGGLALLVTNRVTADYPTLVAEAKHTTTQVESLLSGPPFRVKSTTVKNLLNNVPSYLSKHKSLVEGTVVTGGKIVAEGLAGVVLMLFVTFFLIKDGERIWSWLLGAMGTEAAQRVDRAGHASWLAVVYYMRGTVAVAAIHAIVVGLALWIMGVPLALPLAVLVFLAAFVPLVGLLAAGTLATLVTLATRGWLDAIILLGVLILEDQLEAHLLQPQVVGRVIRLHPLAVILSLAVGGVLAGVPGAVVAIPMVAVITRALPELRRHEESSPDPDDPGGP